MNKYITDQENFWAGNFGDEYISRNKSQNLLSSNIALFSKILDSINNIQSALELGANIGMNLKALQVLNMNINLSGVEINENAYNKLSQLENIEAFHQSILSFKTDKQWDLVFTKGVLIHISPDSLDDAYETLYETSNKWICLIEYYNPTPIEINYRGHSDKLYKRDFCSEIRRKYPGLELVNYGFSYHDDPNFPQDDLTWFLMEK
jgi:pseudaminic acid biosynthesis-associated methylase